jgi:hypothetical protein
MANFTIFITLTPRLNFLIFKNNLILICILIINRFLNLINLIENLDFYKMDLILTPIFIIFVLN